jgi:hypothetical protein
MTHTTTVETVSITDIKEGDTLLDGDGERIVVKTITSCSPHRLRYQDAEGENRCVLLDCVLRVVPEEPTEEEPAEEPVWPDADFIRIIRGTEDGDRIDGSLAFRINSLYRFSLLDGPKAGSCVLPSYDGDAIFEWEEVVPVSKSAVLAGLGTPTEDEPEDDDTESEDEAEDEEEDECDGSCLAYIITQLLSAAAAGKGKEDEE